MCTARISHALEQGCARTGASSTCFSLIPQGGCGRPAVCLLEGPGRVREGQSHRKPGEPAAWNGEERQNRVKCRDSEQEGGREASDRNCH